VGVIVRLRQLIGVPQAAGANPEVRVVEGQQVLFLELVEHAEVGVHQLVYGLVDELGTIVEVHQGLLDAPPPDHLVPRCEPETESI
jgi:hypothetical protein